MSVKKSFSTKSIQSLIASVVMITGLMGFSSAAFSQEQNTTNTIQESTRSKWGCFYRPC